MRFSDYSKHNISILNFVIFHSSSLNFHLFFSSGLILPLLELISSNALYYQNSISWHGCYSELHVSWRGECEPGGPPELPGSSWGAPHQGAVTSQFLWQQAGEAWEHRAKDEASLWRKYIQPTRPTSSKETSWVFPR